MFTPQEIQERFDNLERAVFGGYSMSDVEELLEPLQKDYSALYKENTVLKSKMKVLVERMEGYREQEDNLNRAILTAQKTADDMISEAERKCAKMTAETEERLRQRSEDLQLEIQMETEKVERAKAELQQQVEQATQQAAQERAALQKKIAAEGERMVMAKKAAAAFIVELEDRVQQQLSQLERIKQMDLAVQEEAPATPLMESIPADKPLAETSFPVEEPREVLSEIEMTRQIEENLSRILAEAAKQDQEEKEREKEKANEDTAGDTRAISPVE